MVKKSKKKLKKQEWGEGLEWLQYCLIGLMGLQVVVLLATAMVIHSPGRITGSRDSTSFIPIWAVVFIPLIATRRRLKNEKDKQQSMLVAVGLATMALLVMSVFLLHVVSA